MSTTANLRGRLASLPERLLLLLLIALALFTTRAAMAESVLVGANRSSAVEHTSKDTWLRRQLLALTQGLESVAAVAEMRSAFVLSPLDNAYAPSAFHTFNADGRLFDDHNGERYRETLQLLLSESQMRIWLRQDLKLLCEVQRYRNLHEGRELGLKIALSYRFR